MSLLDLPNEIILHILKQLHATPNGILSVRQVHMSKFVLYFAIQLHTQLVTLRLANL